MIERAYPRDRRHEPVIGAQHVFVLYLHEPLRVPLEPVTDLHHQHVPLHHRDPVLEPIRPAPIVSSVVTLVVGLEAAPDFPMTPRAPRFAELAADVVLDGVGLRRVVVSLQTMSREQT